MKKQKTANPWFRLYSEIIDDPKMLMLSFEDRWHYVALLCLKCQGELDKEANADKLQRKVALKLGVSISNLDEVKRRLKEEELIDENFQPINWNKRQFKSDSSAARVRKYRAKQKKTEIKNVTCNGDVTACNANVTLENLTSQIKPAAESPINKERPRMEQQCNVTVTPSETDTETEIKRSPSKEGDPKKSDAFEKIPITTHWQPSLQAKTLAKLQGLTDFEHQDTLENRGEFISYWITANRGGVPILLTPDEWDHKYIKNLLRGKQHDQANASTSRVSAAERARLLDKTLSDF
ncbi:DnaT-like ssDNA-binding domain-containing protein [Pleionea sediminis]|uniref:DnaT-like ssDNA-binding domain-containing protein n=1 Tax=Pleionea sediminis TaxID=2569479 RepID=UPI0011862E0A|nr:DnaT-like ssDNA-binding domain-containing protein [Pleionea sediminis]